MTKAEFMHQLESGLSFLSPKERGDVVQEFSEHFEVGVERGHSEQSLVDQLGDPRRIVEAYRSEALEKGGLSASTEAPEPPPSEPHAGPRREPEPSGFAHYACIHQRLDPASVRDIQIECADCEVIFAPSEDDSVRVDIEGMTGCNITCELVHGALCVRQQFRLMRLLNWRKEPEIRVSLPHGFSGGLSVDNTSGDIRLPGFRGRALRVHTVSADLKFGDLYATERIQIHTTSGDVRMGKCMADAVALHTTSGDLRFSALTTADLSVTTVSGDIDPQHGAVCEAKELYVKTVSGDIKLALNDHWRAMTFQTVSGDIKLTLPQDSAPFDVALESVSGKVKNQLGSASGSGRAIRAKTVSGDLKIEKG